MDRKDRVYVAIAVQSAILIVQQDRDETRLPVVAVDDVGVVVEMLEGFEHRTAEEREAEALFLVAGIDLVSAEHREVVDKVEPHAVRYERVDPAEHGIAAQLQRKVANVLHPQDVVFVDLPVFGQDHAYLGAQRDKLFRQRADDVGKTAGLDIRKTFTCGK